MKYFIAFFHIFFYLMMFVLFGGALNNALYLHADDLKQTIIPVDPSSTAKGDDDLSQNNNQNSDSPLKNTDENQDFEKAINIAEFSENINQKTETLKPSIPQDVIYPPDEEMKKIFTSTKEIIQTMDDAYSDFYDPTMSTATLLDIVNNPQNYVTIYLENEKIILIKLRPDLAPKTVERFKELVNRDFYDDIEIFRIIPQYILQAGDPSNSGYGGSGVFHKAEISDAKFKAGTVAMANKGNNKSDDTQFFITFNNFEWLNGKYTVFGEVILGLEDLEQLPGNMLNDGFLEKTILIKQIKMLTDTYIDNKNDSIDNFVNKINEQYPINKLQQIRTDQMNYDTDNTDIDMTEFESINKKNQQKEPANSEN